MFLKLIITVSEQGCCFPNQQDLIVMHQPLKDLDICQSYFILVFSLFFFKWFTHSHLVHSLAATLMILKNNF